MRQNSLIVISLCLLFGACGTDPIGGVNFESQKIDSINTDSLVPESFIVSSKIKPLGSGLAYWDGAVGKLIVLDGNGALRKRLINNLGEGPEEIAFFAGFDTNEDYLFIFGAKCLVYDKNTLAFLGKFNLPDADINWIKAFNGTLAIGGLQYEENKYVIFSSRFDPQQGFTQIQEELTVAFPEHLDELSKVTEAEVVHENLFILKPHIGELMKVNERYQQVFDKPLPYRFNQKENVVKYPDGEIDIERLESWSFSSYSDRLLVLRDQDMSSPDEPRNKTHRNTLHVLNQEGEFLGRIRLNNKAVYISVLDNNIYSIDPVAEKYIIYEVLY